VRLEIVIALLQKHVTYRGTLSPMPVMYDSGLSLILEFWDTRLNRTESDIISDIGVNILLDQT
jgi:hypothetical protein